MIFRWVSWPFSNHQAPFCHFFLQNHKWLVAAGDHFRRRLFIFLPLGCELCFFPFCFNRLSRQVSRPVSLGVTPLLQLLAPSNHYTTYYPFQFYWSKYVCKVAVFQQLSQNLDLIFPRNLDWICGWFLTDFTYPFSPYLFYRKNFWTKKYFLTDFEESLLTLIYRFCPCPLRSRYLWYL